MYISSILIWYIYNRIYYDNARNDNCEQKEECEQCSFSAQDCAQISSMTNNSIRQEKSIEKIPQNTEVLQSLETAPKTTTDTPNQEKYNKCTQEDNIMKTQNSVPCDIRNISTICLDAGCNRESGYCVNNTAGTKSCTHTDRNGLLHYRKWWERVDVDILVNGKLISGIPIFIEEDTLRVINNDYSYFIPLEKVDYIRTTDGLDSCCPSVQALKERKPKSTKQV